MTINRRALWCATLCLIVAAGDAAAADRAGPDPALTRIEDSWLPTEEDISPWHAAQDERIAAGSGRPT